MIINISNLKEGEHSFVFTVTGKELDLNDFNFLNDINVDLKLFKQHNQVDLKIHLSSLVRIPCDRCLENFDFNLNNDFELIYKLSYNRDEIDSEEDSSDDFKMISADVHNIDLKKELRDYVLLSFPMKRAPEVKDDICLYCNRNINEILKTPGKDDINPVWEKLLKKKN